MATSRQVWCMYGGHAYSARKPSRYPRVCRAHARKIDAGVASGIRRQVREQRDVAPWWKRLIRWLLRR